MKKVCLILISIMFLVSCSLDFGFGGVDGTTQGGTSAGSTTENSDDTKDSEANDDESTEKDTSGGTKDSTEEENDLVPSEETDESTNSDEEDSASNEIDSTTQEDTTGADNGSATENDDDKDITNGTQSDGGNQQEEEPSPNRDVTIIIYMAADNNLESEGIADINELEAATYDHEKVTVLVLCDRNERYDNSNGDWSDTRLLEIKKDKDGLNGTIVSKQIDCAPLGLKVGEEKELTLSDPSVLSGLLTFAQAEYRAARYALVIWGHGTGWRSRSVSSSSRAVAIDDPTNSYMTISSLHGAVKSAMKEKKLALLGFDTCFGAELEEVYELHDCTDWFCGTAGVETATGWNYTKWLSTCGIHHEDGLALARAIEEQHLEESASTFSIIDASKVTQLFTAFEAFSKVTAKKITTKLRQQKIHDAVLSSTTLYTVAGEASSVYADIYDMSVKITEKYTSLKPEAAALQAAVQSAVCNTQISGKERYPLGVCFCMVDQTGVVNAQFPAAYVNGSAEPEQPLFVKDSAWYVPTLKNTGTLLDKIFFTSF